MSLPATLLATAVLIAAIAFDTAHYLSLKKIADRYDRSPGCAAGSATVDPALPPCTVKTYSVLRPYQFVTVHNTGRHNHYYTHSMLDIQSADGDRRTIELSNTFLWSSIHPGDSIKVQLWQGRSRLIYALGQVAPTTNNPEYQARDAGVVLAVLVILGMAIIAFLVFGVVSAVRRGRMQQPYAPAFFPAGAAPAPAFSYPPPSVPFAGASPAVAAIGGQAAASAAGHWRGTWGSPRGQATSFEASFDVNNAGVIRGRFIDQGRRGEATIAGEQEGSVFRFQKRFPQSGQGVEYTGEVAPDGQSLAGHWRRTGRVLGIPFKTAGTWVATRVPDPNPAQSPLAEHGQT